MTELSIFFIYRTLTGALTNFIHHLTVTEIMLQRVQFEQSGEGPSDYDNYLKGLDYEQFSNLVLQNRECLEQFEKAIAALQRVLQSVQKIFTTSSSLSYFAVGSTIAHIVGLSRPMDIINDMLGLDSISFNSKPLNSPSSSSILHLTVTNRILGRSVHITQMKLIMELLTLIHYLEQQYAPMLPLLSKLKEYDKDNTKNDDHRKYHVQANLLIRIFEHTKKRIQPLNGAGHSTEGFRDALDFGIPSILSRTPFGSKASGIFPSFHCVHPVHAKNQSTTDLIISILRQHQQKDKPNKQILSSHKSNSDK